MGRHLRRTDQAQQAVLLRQPRAAGGEPQLVAELPAAPRVQLLDGQRGIGVEHAVARRSSAHGRTTRGRSAGCARRRRSSIGSTATQETLESYGDETDLDQTLVGTLTSVLSNTKVNTVRVGGVLEDTVHANPAWRALDPNCARCVPCPADAGIGIINAPPRARLRDVRHPGGDDDGLLDSAIVVDRGHAVVVHSRQEGAARHQVRRRATRARG